MIAVEEAEKIVLNHLFKPEAEEIPIDQCVGRVLHEQIVADRDFPPFNRVMMDGIAINHNTWNDGAKAFAIEGMQPAGAPQQALKDTNNCLEVMTGAILPRNTDAVIRYEDITFDKDSHVKVTIDKVNPFQNIHLKGTDRKRNDTLIASGRLISPAEVAVIATVGKSSVKVLRKPVIGLVSTGDELVDVDEMPHPYQIRKSNIYGLEAALRVAGYKSASFHFKDEKQTIEAGLRQVFERCDAVILSGGVSKGKKDYVPEVLEGLGVEKLFHRVAQRPGKPFWFGVRKDKKTVFALPGNPVSTFMCFHRYVKPWLAASNGLVVEQRTAKLMQDFEFPPPLQYFLQVKVKFTNGQLEAYPAKGQGSGDLANLPEADAFLELPAHQQHFKKGEAFPLIRYR